MAGFEMVVKVLNANDAGVFDLAPREPHEPLVLDGAAGLLGELTERVPGLRVLFQHRPRGLEE